MDITMNHGAKNERKAMGGSFAGSFAHGRQLISINNG